MKNDTRLTFKHALSKSFDKYASEDALAYFDEKPMTYKDLQRQIEGTIAFYEKLNIRPGDKIAILSNNMPNWGIAYFAATFMGAAAVPLLPDFSALEVANIIRHSEAKLLMVSEALLKKVNDCACEQLKHIVKINDFTVLQGDMQASYEPGAQPAHDYEVSEDMLASIIYTSGTTGKSKGVMLSHKNLISNAFSGAGVQPIGPKDRFLSILPLSHAYENTLGLILPVLHGSAVYYMRQAPTPSVLLPALKKVRPTMMLSVPLIIEKIYRNKILPSIQDKFISRNLYRIPFFRKKFNLLAGQKLKATFGGKLKFFGVGGAKLDPAVERFLKEAKFPYAIGYGLTETSPLLAGTNAHYTHLTAIGPVVDGVSLKINEPNPETGEGEVWAKGPNVMQGYYKEPEITKEVLTQDGWFKTGDLGVMDSKGRLYIKGRLKNVIIGASGENIYPEEIEAVINNFRYVVESLVVQQKGKLVAYVHLNHDELEKKYQHYKSELSFYAERKFDEVRNELKEYINEKVNKFSRVQLVMIQPEPFQKTATHKIKRFLYTQ